jgi:hypothetical protein
VIALAVRLRTLRTQRETAPSNKAERLIRCPAPLPYTNGTINRGHLFQNRLEYVAGPLRESFAWEIHSGAAIVRPSEVRIP